MHADSMAAFQTLPVRNRGQLEVALMGLLRELSSSDPQPVKTIRDGFSKFNNLARQGEVQLVRSAPGEETVLLSVKDLATMLQSAASSVSLDDALAMSGFKPLPGRLEVGRGRERDTLLEVR